MENRLHIQLEDSLGNQLFALASGWAIAKATGRRFTYSVKRPPYVKINRVADHYGHEYYLNPIAEAFPLFPHLPIEHEDTVGYQFFAETKSFHPELFRIKGDLFLKGHFCDERYFESSIDEVRHFFTLSNQIQTEADNYLRSLQLATTDRYAVFHYRGGDDYITRNSLLDETYALEPLIQFAKDYPGATLIICCDRKPTVISTLRRFFDKVIISNQRALIDLAIMRTASVLVLSNSTFGIWGGVLNNGGKVFCPDLYPISSTEAVDSTIYPKKFLKLASKRRKGSRYAVKMAQLRILMRRVLHEVKVLNR